MVLKNKIKALWSFDEIQSACIIDSSSEYVDPFLGEEETNPSSKNELTVIINQLQQTGLVFETIENIDGGYFGYI